MFFNELVRAKYYELTASVLHIGKIIVRDAAGDK